MTPPRAQPVMLQGPSGRLEAIIEAPATDGATAVSVGAPRAFLVVCHPHPLHGGTMHNKVVTTLARCATDLGVPALRFNYRGVGASEGVFDDARGETDDALAAVAEGRQRWPGAVPWLAGFSFGGHVALRASTSPGASDAARLVTIAPAITRRYVTPEEIRAPACPWLLVQGAADEVIDAGAVIEWAPRIAPPPRLVVMADTGHFFHGRLNDLKDVVLPFLRD